MLRKRSVPRCAAVIAGALLLLPLAGCGFVDEVQKNIEEQDASSPTPTPDPFSESGVYNPNFDSYHGVFLQELPDDRGEVLCVWANKSDFRAGIGISCDWDSAQPAPASDPHG